MHKFLSIVALLFLAVYLLTAVGCNTMNGFGKDLQSWTADETHGHNMAQQQRSQQYHNGYQTSQQYNR